MSATYCVACKKYSWPVTPHCKYCSAPTVLKPVPKRNGRVLEFCSIPSSDNRETMALIELGAIRVVGRIVNPQKIIVGCNVVLKNCGVSPDGAPYYAFEIVG